MAFDQVRMERGQVWVIRFHNQEQVGCEQMKDRPWLILSVGKFNQSSGMITAVPITTKDSIRTPAQVLFENMRGQSNVILCEQIRSFDTRSGAYTFDYMANISDKVLERVDVALSVHLGLHYSPITLQKLYDSMEAIIKSVGYMQEKANTPKFTDEDVLEFATKLESLTSAIIKPQTVEETPKSEPQTVSGITLDEETLVPEPEDTSSIKVQPKVKRHKWTIETCKKFLEDASTLPMKEVMEKWNIAKKTDFSYRKTYVKSRLSEMSSEKQK